MVLDLRRVGHASPPALGLRGLRGWGGAFSALAVAGVLRFAAGFAFAPSSLGLAAALFAALPAPVCVGLSVVLGVGGGEAFASSAFLTASAVIGVGAPFPGPSPVQIGRASCRERGCQYV